MAKRDTSMVGMHYSTNFCKKHTYTHAQIYFVHVVTETNTDKKPHYIQRTETHIHIQVSARIAILKLFVY